VKPAFALIIGTGAVVFGLLAGCGQTGPLYMPPPAKPKPPAPAVPAPPPSSPAAQ